MRQYIKFLMLFLALSTALNAKSTIGLNINNEDLEGEVNLEFGSNPLVHKGTRYYLEASALKSKEVEDKEMLIQAGIIGENRLKTRSVIWLGLGFKAVFADEYTAFPLQARATFKLSEKLASFPLHLILKAAVAPSVLSFNEAKGYSEVRGEIDGEVIPNIHLYMGLRRIQTNYKHKDITFDSAFYCGLRMSF